MYKVNVMNPCSCFIKGGFSESSEFDTKEEAQKEARKLLSEMESNFCKKHEFSVMEQFGDFTIYIKPRR